MQMVSYSPDYPVFIDLFPLYYHLILGFIIIFAVSSDIHNLLEYCVSDY
jgi:hypothetical protein